MRLLDTTTHKLKLFHGDVPPYAILSHRWRENEVTFQDLQAGDASQLEAYDKIARTCSIAAAAGLQYTWIDTCCINKTDSVELSEAINSMYRWYEESTVCYAYLGDITWDDSFSVARDIDTSDNLKFGYHLNLAVSFCGAEWFTRGWTLQELIAPSVVIFLDQGWIEIGTKLSMCDMVSSITGIPKAILSGADVDSASIAQRMSWVSRWRTTKVEDTAYCLMGLFGVNMPLLYGEGGNAFFRLQEEILKVSTDYSIFCHSFDLLFGGTENGRSKFLAASPVDFEHSARIVPNHPEGIGCMPVRIDSQGFHLQVRLATRESLKGGVSIRNAILPCQLEALEDSTIGDREEKGLLSVVIPLVAATDLGQVGVFRLFNGSSAAAAGDIDEAKFRSMVICVQHSRGRVKRRHLLPRLAAGGHTTLIKMVLNKGVGPPIRRLACHDALPEAAATHSVDAVEVFLEMGCDDRRLLHESSRDALKRVLNERYWSEPGDLEKTVTLLVQKGLFQTNRVPDLVNIVLGMSPFAFSEHGDGDRRVASLLNALDKEERRRFCLEYLGDPRVAPEWAASERVPPALVPLWRSPNGRLTMRLNRTRMVMNELRVLDGLPPLPEPKKLESTGSVLSRRRDKDGN
ncbi:heterokaryon incompatibility protein-domain-containing protein [Cercophora newfieldiana]|uniref:Heterokaryon incompatibility protein-domain-containing protein n=1 Tax=Cercophora newfieldiana TaxID=92897 RepID=A0AA40CQ06_9PEZI|nr:heterokaryon incompatibility protein-domain-containing protein [Cercophora newfieldiana]